MEIMGTIIVILGLIASLLLVALLLVTLIGIIKLRGGDLVNCFPVPPFDRVDIGQPARSIDFVIDHGLGNNIRIYTGISVHKLKQIHGLAVYVDARTSLGYISAYIDKCYKEEEVIKAIAELHENKSYQELQKEDGDV